MYCEVCGTPIPKGSQFCPNCGRPVQKEAPQKPMLLRWGLPALIVVMIAAVLCGLLFRSRMNEHGTQEAQVPQPLSMWSQELPEAYETLLSDYANAIEHGWSSDRLAEADLSYMASYYYDPANLGYLCTDLDRDSVPELFLGDMVSQENGTPFFFELYTLTDGTLTRLFSGGERDTLSLCLDGTVMEKGADGAYSSCVYYYTLETGGTLHLKESLQLLSDSGDVSSWIHRIGEGDEGEIISDQEASAVQSSYALSDLTMMPVPSSGPSAVSAYPITVNMDQLLSANLLGATFQQAAEAGWVEEWMYVFIHGCSDPDVIFEEYWYDESLGQWTYYGIPYDDAADAGWGEIWKDIMRDYVAVE